MSYEDVDPEIDCMRDPCMAARERATTWKPRTFANGVLVYETVIGNAQILYSLLPDGRSGVGVFEINTPTGVGAVKFKEATDLDVARRVAHRLAERARTALAALQQ